MLVCSSPTLRRTVAQTVELTDSAVCGIIEAMTSLLENIARIPIDTLKEFPGNPRRGDVRAIAESLRENGQFQPIIIQRSTDYILAGNHTWKAALSLGWTHLDSVYVDVGDVEAKKIVLAANKTSDLGTYNNEDLAKLLRSLDGDYQGSVWTPGEVDVLLSAFVEPELMQFNEVAPVASEPVVMEQVPRTNAAYAETPQQEAARAERQAAQTPRPYAGLSETMLLYTEQEKSEFAALTNVLRTVYGHEVRTPQLVLNALRGIAYALTEESVELSELKKQAGLQ